MAGDSSGSASALSLHPGPHGLRNFGRVQGSGFRVSIFFFFFWGGGGGVRQALLGFLGSQGFFWGFWGISICISICICTCICICKCICTGFHRVYKGFRS